MYLLLPLVDESPIWPWDPNQPELEAIRQHPAIKVVPKLPVCCLQIGVLLAHDGLVDRQVCGNAKCRPQQYEQRSYRHGELRSNAELSREQGLQYLLLSIWHSSCKITPSSCQSNELEHSYNLTFASRMHSRGMG